MNHLRYLSRSAPLARGAISGATASQLETALASGAAWEAQVAQPWLLVSDQRRRNSSVATSPTAAILCAASAAPPPPEPASVALSLALPQSLPDRHAALVGAWCPDSSSSPLAAFDPVLTAPGLPPEAPALSMVAHTSLEDNLGLVLSPTQLGVQLWEGVHAATGLPWWASIPAATLAVRAATLPLSLRAYAASSNVALLHQAFGLSRRVAEAVAEAEAGARQGGRVPAQGARVDLAAKGPGSDSAAARAPSSSSDGSVTGTDGSSSSSGIGSGVDGTESVHASGQGTSGPTEGGTSAGAVATAGGSAVSLGRLELVRRVLSYLRVQHGAPSFGWYAAGAAVQVPLAVTLTLALRRMSESLWPGLTGQGLAYFKDLTAPPMYLETLSTPYGTAGAILPLALVLTYVVIADRSAGGSSPGINTALKLLVLPLYCSALLQPHAVLLYWLALAASQLAVYELAARVPPLRRVAGIPDMLQAAPKTPHTSAGVQGPGSGAADPLDPLLLGLAEAYGKAGNTAAARSCLEALLRRQPDNVFAAEQLQALRKP